MDLNQIRQKLASLQDKGNRNNVLWKPSPGKQVIRLLPYKGNPDYPFIELMFHYNIGTKNYLSPITNGNPDPIQEFSEKLKQTGDSEDYKRGKTLEPKMRIYAPVLVRGKENEGVKYWGFGKLVYTELLGIMDDADYGDISDPVSGHDITVEFKTAEEAGKNFPVTTVRPKPAQTAVTEDTNVLEMIKNQPDVKNIFKEPTYEELETALENWLNPTEDEAAAAKTTSVTAAKSDTVTKVEASGKTFDELFKEK